ncbi:hypothetical protein AURDEDRAFT_177006 [Auricularia subglabra TFB-10046 SS5]|uniref:Uncharacterized protein n=1 Tax=Auricularia subglabra (strain TFB-10046 / SS5) TaxID=717982 RepID=J0D5A7_AURST|nr:hypothetical protein AURDEDRAFT_177006 [Auricularia subglabra TFB-10046 SS5]
MAYRHHDVECMYRRVDSSLAPRIVPASCLPNDRAARHGTASPCPDVVEPEWLSGAPAVAIPNGCLFARTRYVRASSPGHRAATGRPGLRCRRRRDAQPKTAHAAERLRLDVGTAGFSTRGPHDSGPSSPWSTRRHVLNGAVEWLRRLPDPLFAHPVRIRLVLPNACDVLDPIPTTPNGCGLVN